MRKDKQRSQQRAWSHGGRWGNPWGQQQKQMCTPAWPFHNAVVAQKQACRVRAPDCGIFKSPHEGSIGFTPLVVKSQDPTEMYVRTLAPGQACQLSVCHYG